MTTRFALGIWMTAVVLATAALLVPTFAGSFSHVTAFPYWLEATVNGPAFATVGVVVVWRRPTHPIGWILLAVGATGAVQLASGVYAASTPSLPWAPAIGLLSKVAQWGLTALFLLLLLLFPTGRLPSRRWLPVAICSIVAMALAAFVTVSTAGPLADFPQHDNPISHLTPEAVRAPLIVASAVTGAVGLVGSLCSIVVRLRRAAGLERQQVKLFSLAGVLGLLILPLGSVAPDRLAWFGSLLWTLFPLGLAVAISAAVLRHGLYGIDRAISRTVLYTIVTLVVVGVYVVFAVVPAALFDLDSDLLIAGATLAAAAAFGPVRRQTQSVVDRRFNRSRYDARQVADAFAVRLRDEVRLDTLVGDLGGVVATTVQPASVSVWIRPGSGRSVEVRA